MFANPIVEHISMLSKSYVEQQIQFRDLSLYRVGEYADFMLNTPWIISKGGERSQGW